MPDLDQSTYLAEIAYNDAPNKLNCKCGSCSWTGTALELKDIEGAALTPGDESPAGRCPECDALAYIGSDKDERKAERAYRVIARKQGWNSESLVTHLEAFIRHRGLMGKFAEHVKSAANEENGHG
jgi:hypothetical protein